MKLFRRTNVESVPIEMSRILDDQVYELNCQLALLEEREQGLVQRYRNGEIRQGILIFESEYIVLVRSELVKQRNKLLQRIDRTSARLARHALGGDGYNHSS